MTPINRLLPPEPTTYLRREIQSVAKRVRLLVEAKPTMRQLRPGEHDTLECNLIRYFRGVADDERSIGMEQHVFSGFLLSLLFRRYKRALRGIRYIAIREGRAVVRMTERKPARRAAQ